MRTQTNKPRRNNPNDEWYTYHQDEQKFKTREDVEAWLEKEYGDCARSKMYRDTKDGEAEHIGWIYRYKAPPSSHDDCHHFMQDWIEVVEFEPRTVII